MSYYADRRDDNRCPNCGQHTQGEPICPHCGAVLSEEDEEMEGFHEEDEDLEDEE